MAHKFCFGALDRLLRDIMSRPNTPFGGKVVVFSGDFRQVLPVIERGSRAAIVQAALKNHELWRHFTVLNLRINMRVQLLLQDPARSADAARLQEWSDYLLQVGEGRTGQPMQLPEDMIVPGDQPLDLIRDVFGDIAADANARDPSTLISRYYLHRSSNSVHSRLAHTPAHAYLLCLHHSSLYLSSSFLEHYTDADTFFI